ncbi:MAG: TolC family protein [Bacteroidales bacterium]|nr:TolC family protein [Bacteroidales bacterium]
MKNINILLLAALSLAVCSCGLYGKYTPQMTEEEELAIKVPSYKDIFQDEKLVALIDSALSRNLDLKMAHERVRQADFKLTSAKLAYLPRLFAGANPVVSIGLPGQVDMSKLSYSFGMASWEIDIFGRVTNRKRIAQSYRDQLSDYEQAARVELVSAVASLYFTLQMLDAQVAATDSATSNWKASVEAVRAMKEAGLEDEAAVSQFEGSYYATSASGKTLRLVRDVAENSMRLLLCCDSCDVPRNPIYEVDRPLVNADAVKSIDLNAVRVRPDVKAAEKQLAQSFYNVNLARANCCPDISINGTVGWADGAVIFNLVGNLLQPIFNAGENINMVKVSKSQLDESTMAYANALLKAGNEVNNSVASIKTYYSQVEDYSKRVEAMERALEATQLKMKFGRGTYLEVLTAQNNLLESQIEEIQNKADILIAVVDLYSALGGGR